MRFGLLGTGPWAAGTQAAALVDHPQATFVGVWGRNPTKVAALAERYGVAAHDDVDSLLAEVDAVAVALPPDIQAELAVRAAAAGRHLLLDKPLALDTTAADRIVDEVATRGLASLVFFTNRFYPAIEAFLREAAATGGWHGARVTLFASIFQDGNPYGASPWRRAKGGLWDIGPHALSMVLPVLGPVEDVRAVAGPRATTHLLLRHHSGAVSTLSLSLDAPPAATLADYLFHGERGLAAPPPADIGVVSAFAAAVTELVRMAGAGRAEHPCDVRFGREVVAVLEAAERALKH